MRQQQPDYESLAATRTTLATTRTTRSRNRCFLFLSISLLMLITFLFSFSQTVSYRPIATASHQRHQRKQKRQSDEPSPEDNEKEQQQDTEQHLDSSNKNVDEKIEKTLTPVFSLDAAIEDQTHGSNVSDTRKEPHTPRERFVICTRIKNEAPYLVEWIEYHRMIGFERFYLMNNDSTDQTQCILDAYIQRGVVHSMNHVEHEHQVFDACVKQIKKENKDTGDANGDVLQHLWMATHDVDEFIWVQSEDDDSMDTGTSVSQLHKAVIRLKRRHSSMQSMYIPRFLFGSSGHDHYKPDLVISRFTHRFDPQGCPRTMPQQLADERGSAQPQERQLGHRQLKIIFDTNGKPQSFCNHAYNVTVPYYGEGKGMSLVSAMAQDCLRQSDRPHSRRECQGTHFHKLHNVTASRATGGRSTTTAISPLFVKGEDWERNPTTLGDARYVGDAEIVNDIAIMHYMTRSREEFFQRTCASRWIDKYQRCGDMCTPETFFNLSETYSNNVADTRMIPLAEQLDHIFQTKDTVNVSTCNLTAPEHKPWHFYRNCWRRKQQRKKPKTQGAGG